MNNLTRAEAIEEYKAIIDEEIDRLRTMRESETDAERWLKLDNDIDALLIKKDNAAATIDAARLPADRDDADILSAARKVSPNAVLVGDLTRAAYMEAPENIGTRFTVSGGEVIELDNHLESGYEERTEEDMPF